MPLSPLGIYAARYTTSPGSAVKTSASTRLATEVASTASTSQCFNPQGDYARTVAPITAATHHGLEIPLYYPATLHEGDRINDLNSFCDVWASVVERLASQHLTEREVLDLLEDDFLQRAFGKNLKPLILDAFMRSIQPVDDLRKERLREIVEVIGDLPQHRWASVLGEHLSFTHDPDAPGVAAFIQAPLKADREHKAEMIANRLLLTDTQWQRLCEIFRQSSAPVLKAWDRQIEHQLDIEHPAEWVDLADISHVRPSPDTALFLLDQYVQILHEEPALKLETYELIRCINHNCDPTSQAPRSIEEQVNLRFHVRISQNTLPSIEGDQSPLLVTLKELERKCTFAASDGLRGPSIPDGLLKKVLYVLNWQDTGGKLMGPAMDPGLRVGVRSPVTNYLALEHKPKVPARTLPPVPRNVTRDQTASHGTFGRIEDLAQQVDTVLTTITHTMTGWRPVDAVPDPRTLFNTFFDWVRRSNVKTPFRQIPQSSYGALDAVYSQTTVASDAPSDDGTQAAISALATTIKGWLAAASGYLNALGAPVLVGAAGLAQQNPRSVATIALVAVHAAVAEFYSQWFADETGSTAGHFAPEADAGLRDTIAREVESVLENVPDVMRAVRARIDISSYQDPHQDPQLEADVASLLEQTVVSRIEFSIKNARARYVLQHTAASSTADKADRYDEAGAERSERRKRAAQWTLEAMNDADVRSQADRDLQQSLVALLLTDADSFISIPNGTLLHPLLERYKQALRDPGPSAFFNAKGLDLSTIKLSRDSVTGDVTRNGHVFSEQFSLFDNSGWWQASRQLLPIMRVLDPDNHGLCYLGEDSSSIEIGRVFKFYGSQLPRYQDDDIEFANQLNTSGWPEFTAAKRARLNEAFRTIDRVAEEDEERAHLLCALELIVKGKPDNAAVSLSDMTVEFAVPRLSEDSNAIRQHLNDFLVLPAMAAICKRKKIDCHAYTVRITERKIQVHNGDTWVDLTRAVRAQPALLLQLDRLFEQAKKTGRSLYTSQTLNLLQVIRYKGFDKPKNVGEVRNIIGWLNTSLPPAPPMGNYAAELLAGSATFPTLSPTDKTTIISLTKTLLAGAPSIIDAWANRSVEDHRANAEALLSEMLQSEWARDWGQQLVEKLGWYGASEQQESSTFQYQQLLSSAIKLCVDPESGSFGDVAGYDVYHPKNMGRELTAIRAEIEQHLIVNKGVTEYAAPLVAHVFLAGAAPELLAQDLSDCATLGSMGWMLMRLGVNVAEAIHPGSSRRMTYAQLTSIALLDAATEESRMLFKTLSVDIFIGWGVMNGMVRRHDELRYNAEDYEVAAHFFARLRGEVTEAIGAVAQPQPSRRDLAIIELRKIFPSASVENIERMVVRTTSLSELMFNGVEHGLLEVYMAGDLKPGNWWMPGEWWRVDQEKHDEAQLGTLIRQLPDLASVLSDSIDLYLETLQKGLKTSLKLLFASMPLEDRLCLELGEIQLFTLREETGILLEDETSEIRGRHRGRSGTLLRCETDTGVSYFEVFPEQMNIIKRVDLPRNLPVNGVIKMEDVKVSKGSPVKHEVNRGTQLPFDFQAYSSGSEPRANVNSDKIIIEKLGGSFPATTESVDLASYVPNIYFSSKVSSIVDRIISENLVEGQKEVLVRVATVETSRDKQNAYWKKVNDFVMQLIPFVGCVEDLNSGTRMGLIKGTFGCFTDAISSVSAMASGAGKAAGVIKSMAPVRIKAFEILTITSTSMASVINPLSGLADLVAGTARGLKRVAGMVVSGAFEITQSGVQRLQTAMDEFRSCLGLLPAAAASKSKPTWIKAGHVARKGIHRGANVTAIQDQAKWYGVDNDGVPFGPPLDDFRILAI